MPSTDGYGITISYTYSSVHQDEIDELEKKLPKGMIVTECEGLIRDERAD